MTNHSTRCLRVYVSGPYSADPDAYTATAISAADEILQAGHAPLVPHLKHYWHTRHRAHGYEEWMRVDLAWLAAADVVVRLPGVSPGADRETALARGLGVPVVAGLPALLRWAGEARPADQPADPRDRIAAALHKQLPGCTHDEHGADCLALAAAVLPLLPPPADRAAILSDAERTMLAYALDQAQERIWSEGGFTDEDQDAVDSLRRLAAEAQTGHVYLSTGCYHGNHAYCQGMTGLAGAKRPGECKHCGAKCVCGCHRAEAPQPETETSRPVHAVPLPGSGGISACCRRPPCEFVGERVTRNPAEVTCTGVVPEPAADTGEEADA